MQWICSVSGLVLLQHSSAIKMCGRSDVIPRYLQVELEFVLMISTIIAIKLVTITVVYVHIQVVMGLKYSFVVLFNYHYKVTDFIYAHVFKLTFACFVVTISIFKFYCMC